MREISTFDQQISINAEVPLRQEFEIEQKWDGTFTREEYISAFFYHGSHGALAAVRSEKWKLTLNPGLKLFDLEADPGERTPVNNREVKRKLRGMVIQFQREMNMATY